VWPATLPATLQFTALIAVGVFTLWKGSGRAQRGYFGVFVYTLLAIGAAWPQSEPYKALASVQLIFGFIFVLPSVSRPGFWEAGIFAGLTALSLSAHFGIISAGLYPHLLGGGYYALLIMVIWACYEPNNISPYFSIRDILSLVVERRDASSADSSRNDLGSVSVEENKAKAGATQTGR